MFRMMCLSIIFDLHDSTTIVAISMINDMLDPSIRKVNMILSLNITSFITISFFSKVCVILVIMHSILEVERIRTVVITTSMTSSSYMPTSNMTTTNSSWRAKGQVKNGKKDTKGYLHDACTVYFLKLIPM